jgi:hypothetical protein
MMADMELYNKLASHSPQRIDVTAVKKYFQNTNLISKPNKAPPTTATAAIT